MDVLDRFRTFQNLHVIGIYSTGWQIDWILTTKTTGQKPQPSSNGIAQAVGVSGSEREREDRIPAPLGQAVVGAWSMAHHANEWDGSIIGALVPACARVDERGEVKNEHLDTIGRRPGVEINAQ